MTEIKKLEQEIADLKIATANLPVRFSSGEGLARLAEECLVPVNMGPGATVECIIRMFDKTYGTMVNTSPPLTIPVLNNSPNFIASGSIIIALWCRGQWIAVTSSPANQLARISGINYSTGVYTWYAIKGTNPIGTISDDETIGGGSCIELNGFKFAPVGQRIVLYKAYPSTWYTFVAPNPIIHGPLQSDGVTIQVNDENGTSTGQTVAVTTFLGAGVPLNPGQPIIATYVNCPGVTTQHFYCIWAGC